MNNKFLFIKKTYNAVAQSVLSYNYKAGTAQDQKPTYMPEE
jgi:hypothetical protein